MKKLEVAKDGRVLVRTVFQRKAPSNFMIVVAYEEKVVCGMDEEEVSWNLWKLTHVAGPDHPQRRRFDPVVVGMFWPVQ